MFIIPNKGVYLYCCNEATTLNFRIMAFIDILNNPNEITENDLCIINLKTGHITWKPGKFNPKMQANINYWLSKKNN